MLIIIKLFSFKRYISSLNFFSKDSKVPIDFISLTQFAILGLFYISLVLQQSDFNFHLLPLAEKWKKANGQTVSVAM